MKDVEQSRQSVLKTALELFGAFVVYLTLACALTWPVAPNLSSVLIGGGELGGWLWRQWWHFEEIRALKQMDMGVIGSTEALISLGRFPETGNILDIILFSFPLRNLVGFPVDHNLKVLLILIGNGMCGYALARGFTDSFLVSIAAGAIAIFNPLVIQDINKLGLRQVVLWWVLLLPIFLQRAGRSCSVRDGTIVGIIFTLIAGFYWFYGLFAGLFGIIWLLWWWIKNKPPFFLAARWLSAAGITAVIGVFFFLMPYFSTGEDATGAGGAQQLPEVTFFLEYPAYDTISTAPERPTNYQENVLSSLHRGIDSAWPADVVLDPRHGVKAFPVVILFFGVIPCFFIRRSEKAASYAKMYLFVWFFFWLGAMGPFLKWGPFKDTSEVITIGDYVIRMPYAYLFQYIPGMSRMFAPYRLSALMVVASVALVALSLDGLRNLQRRIIAVLFFTLLVLQPFYRFDLEDNDLSGTPSTWRIPIQSSGFKLPDWYLDLDPDGWEGIIELPLDQQQDLLCAYQSFHHRKVYRSWATLPAIPPWVRRSGGDISGKRLRWLGKEAPRNDPLIDFFRDISREPMTASMEDLTSDNVRTLMKSGDYRWLIVHERGYYLLNPNQGDIMYRDVVRRMEESLGIEAQQVIEQETFDWPGKLDNFPPGPAWVPWASQEVQKPIQDMPEEYMMAIFDLGNLMSGMKDVEKEAIVEEDEGVEESENDDVSEEEE